MIRAILFMIASAIIAIAAPGPLQAQTYPSRPVRIFVGFQAGGSTDVLVRIVAQWLSQRLGQPFVVENRPGAAGNIATSAALHAPADGYTLLTLTSTGTVNATLYDNLDFDFTKDIAPV